MENILLPENEMERIRELESYDIMDTVQEEDFDSLTRLASVICGTPIALVTLLDSRRQWFKSKVGLDDVTESPRNISFCQHAILNDELFEVTNALKDQRFAENPLVTGSEHIRFYAGVPLKTERGFNLGTLCVIDTVPRDLTEDQKEAMYTLAKQVITQLELRKKNTELEKEKKQIEILSSAKDTFHANMSHEIRTPLNAVIGFSDVLGNTQLTESQKEYVESIRHAGQKLLLLINDVLDFSKINTGKVELENQVFNFKALIRKNFSLFKITAVEKQLEYKLDIDAKVPDFVSSDQLRLSQVMMNLIGNAFKFTKYGSVAVKLDLVEENSEKALVKFSFSDSGIGIPESQLHNIFERFTQADSDISRKYGGTGLGLSIAKSLVELYGGELKIDSELGRGTDFTFEIWFTKGDPLPEAPSSHAVDNIKPGHFRILLCEDILLNQKLVQNILTPDKFSIRVASNGKEAVKTLEKENFDLILMDLQMPEMGGLEASEIIISEMKITTPIIALTAETMRGELQKCLDLGMVDYITKPFRQDNLLQKIYMHLPAKSADKICEMDFTYLQSLSRGDKEFERNMITLFMEEVPVDLADISEAFHSKKLDQVSKFAHKLKSSLPLVGLNSLTPILIELETATDFSPELSSAFHNLEKNLLNCFDQLAAMLNNAETN